MGLMLCVFEIAIVVVIAYYIYKFFCPTVLKPPKVRDGWYGRRVLKEGEAIPEDDITINKFNVHISDDVLDDLKRRLELSRFVEPIEGTEFNYGFNGEYLKEVVEYWKSSYDWRKQENELNKYDHYFTQIEGINIHFIHVKPTKPVKTVIPLMVIHGWPGSVYEYYKSFPLLTQPVNDIAFEVICPSLPGFGFSEAPHQRAFTGLSTARIFAKLMDRLGHKRFFVHGGDWGSFVSRTLSIMHSQHIRGVHTTLNSVMIGVNAIKGVEFIKYVTAMFAPSLVFDEPERDYQKLFPFWEKFFFQLRESGYLHIQATKPDTIGAALNDSPVGLAAYILEKFSTCTNADNVRKSDGGLTEKFTLDELLTNVMIYWASGNVASSMRYYKENITHMSEQLNIFKIPVTVPAAVADFPHEINRIPKLFARYQYHDLVQYTEMTSGGHFAAFEEPTLLCDDIRKFVVTVLNRQ